MALLKDGTRIYGNLQVDGNIVVGTTATISGNVDVTGNVTAYGTVSGVTLYGASLQFSDTSVQSTAYRISRSTYNTSAPSASLDNLQVGINLGWQPYFTPVNPGTVNVSVSLSTIIQPAATPGVITGSAVATYSIYSYLGPGPVSFANPYESVSGIVTDEDAGKAYQVTWFAGPTASQGYVSIQQI